MNYFAHGLRFLDRPHFLAGTAVPDWLGVADRKTRVRPRLVEPVARGADPVAAEIAAGILQHFHDDSWFHSTRAFAQTTAELTSAFRELLGAEDDLRAGFLGHVATELLLDRALIAERPAALDAYYAALENVDPTCVASVVNRASRRATDRLAPLIPLFLRDRFLYDYLDSPRLLARLNQVLRRINLSPLPEAAVSVLDAGRGIVAARVDDLLPAQRFGDW